MTEDEMNGAMIVACQGPPICEFDGSERFPDDYQSRCHFCTRIYINDDGSEAVVEPSHQ